jgi:hypothetical protein
MNLWIWVWTPIVIGILLFIFSIINTIKTAIKEKRFSFQSVLNILLIAVSVCWVAIGVYGFIVLQSQLSS